MLNRRGRNFSYAGVFRTLNQEGKVVAVGSVSLKRFFVEQAFNAATEANLVGISLKRIGQLSLRCQQPRKITTEAAAMPVAIRPKGHNQLDFFLTTAILPQTCDVLLSAYAQSWKVARRGNK